MKKKLNGTQIAVLVLSLLPVILAAIFYHRLPAQIPTHWGFNGEVTYSDRGSIWTTAIISIPLGLLLIFIPRIDPRKRNYVNFQKYYDGFAAVMMVFETAMTGIIISESLNPGRVAISSVICGLVGLLFIFIGNMMPKFKSNFFVGIKTPWTLSSDVVWYKTHRLGGILWFIGGILIVVSSFLFGDVGIFVALMAILVVISVIPIAMSYVWYRRLPKDGPET